MTVSYSSEVTTSRGFSVFVKLLGRWKGSIYKLIWRDVLIFLVLFYAINFTYRFGLDGPAKIWFEKIVKYCNEYYTLIPLSFVLGFYVTMVMNRWWEQFQLLPYPDNLALLLSASVQNQDDNARMIRRTVARYVCLSFAITMSLRSPRVKKRFPTLNHFVESGLMMKDEMKIFDDLEEEFPGYAKYWLPLAWAGNIITKTRREGFITSDQSVKSIMQELNKFRTKCGSLLDYDWIGIPLVYTQVVTLAVYSYFLTTLLAKQYVQAGTDLYFPFLTILEFFFYMGWLKVAETLINPFGDDDDDFEVNYLIDRNVLVTYLLVDKMHQEHPKLVKDQYWQNMAPQHLPYTACTEQEAHPPSCTDKIIVKSVDGEIITETQTKEKIDGKMSRQGSWFKRLMKRNPKLKPKDNLEDPDEIIELQMDYNMSTPLHGDKIDGEPVDNSEFDKLKLQRQAVRKQKLKRYIILARKGSTDEDQLIDEIVEGVADDKSH